MSSSPSICSRAKIHPSSRLRNHTRFSTSIRMSDGRYFFSSQSTLTSRYCAVPRDVLYWAVPRDVFSVMTAASRAQDTQVVSEEDVKVFWFQFRPCKAMCWAGQLVANEQGVIHFILPIQKALTYYSTCLSAWHWAAGSIAFCMVSSRRSIRATRSPHSHGCLACQWGAAQYPEFRHGSTGEGCLLSSRCQYRPSFDEPHSEGGWTVLVSWYKWQGACVTDCSCF